MKRDTAQPGQPVPLAESERLFTVDSANEALVLVRRIVRDIVREYNELMTLRAEHQELSVTPNSHVDVQQFKLRIEARIDRLNALHAELANIGCELKDWSRGLVDFPAEHAGRRVYLCWKLDEPRVEYWHELHAGYGGRQPVPSDFGTDASVAGESTGSDSAAPPH